MEIEKRKRRLVYVNVNIRGSKNKKQPPREWGGYEIPSHCQSHRIVYK